MFDLSKIPFLKRLISMPRLIVEVLNDQNLFTESNLANWFSSYVQFCSGDHFSERAEAAWKSGKINNLKVFQIDLGEISEYKLSQTFEHSSPRALRFLF